MATTRTPASCAQGWSPERIRPLRGNWRLADVGTSPMPTQIVCEVPSWLSTRRVQTAKSTWDLRLASEEERQPPS